MSDGKGAGMSRYNGLRVQLTVIPQTGRGLVTVTRKHWRDGWDCWTRIAPLQRFGATSVQSDLEALHVMRDVIAEMISRLENDNL